MPSQTFTHTASARASVDVVWSALDRPETWEAIGAVDRVFDPNIDSQGRLQGFSFDTVAAGKKYVGKATPHQRIEGERMSWRVTTTDVKGLTTVDLARADDGTAIKVTLVVESAGPLSTLFFPVIAAAIGNGLPASVDAFAASFRG